MRSEVYAGGQHLATYANGTTYFNHADWLGTSRVRTGPTGAVAESYQSLPFGDSPPANGAISPQHFTDLEHDAESGLDHTLFRQYNGSLGRWTSPDPLAGNIGDPQSLNRYAYVGNNPVNFTDPEGLLRLPPGFGGGGGGELGNCTVDGLDTPCSIVSGLLTAGAAAQCPTTHCIFDGDHGLLIFPNALAKAAYSPGNCWVSPFDGVGSVWCGSGDNRVQIGVSGGTNLSFAGGPQTVGPSGPGIRGGGNSRPTPTLIHIPIPSFHMNYCGPGTGSGNPSSGVDAACMRHDACYEAAGLNGLKGDSMNPFLSVPKEQARAACDRQLCSDIANNIPESRSD